MRLGIAPLALYLKPLSRIRANTRKPGICRFAAAILLFSCSIPFPSSRSAAEPQRTVGDSLVTVRKNESTFLILSDIHFDPLTGTDRRGIEALVTSPVEKWQSILESFADHDISHDGTDTNYRLLASALNAAAGTGFHYDYVLILGDYLGHDFPKKYREFRSDGRGYEDFVIKTMLFVDRMIGQSFPTSPVYGTLGNNDTSGGDYHTQNRSFLTALANSWKTIAVNREAARDFRFGGYYALPHPTVPAEELLVLNTSLWSRVYSDTPPEAVNGGSTEIAWLAHKLDAIRSRRHTATLLMHIPPGIDAVTSAKNGMCAPPSSFWEKSYLDSFLAIIGAHQDLLRDSYAGHIHFNDFRIIKDANGMPYFQTHIAPSISRDHHTSPAFEVGVYDRLNGNMVNYALFYLEVGSEGGDETASDWKRAFDFRKESTFPVYSPNSLETMALLIRSSDTIRSKILDIFSAHVAPSSPLPAEDWLAYSCAQTEITPAAFSACSCHAVTAP